MQLFVGRHAFTIGDIWQLDALQTVLVQLVEINGQIQVGWKRRRRPGPFAANGTSSCGSWASLNDLLGIGVSDARESLQLISGRGIEIDRLPEATYEKIKDQVVAKQK